MAIFPEDADYEARDFIWRLSSATADQEESVFTKLPDYDRVLMVLEGDAVLAYEGQRVARLKELEQDRFDGGFSARSFGKIRDYNLMVRKGGEGYLDVLKLTEQSQVLERDDPTGFDHACQAFYCHQGYGVVVADGHTSMVREGQQLVIRYHPDEPATIAAMGDGILIRAQIYYQDMAVSAPEIPDEKGTFEDFKECVKLSLTNFRGSRFVFRYLNDICYDESLKRGIQRIERCYLPMVVWFVGIAVLGIYGGSRLSPLPVLYGLVGWTALVMLVLSPLLYFLAVPKPVKAHIKALGNLTEHEKRIYRQGQEANPMLEKILKKYKISGRNVYVEDDRPRRKKKPRA